ncbi:CHASE domain-containing protein [Limnobacter humi]|uniref:histidine kinase n=1 Tax=Limnobacter humi TaxID=1778671 RepID=A0ABT1WGX7_9BURK|nr:CHASE domain-containing protein [Limnobacter humi]MCQ8896772.1 CHASE domain-containing protein [Limnobacter humi]
MIINELSQDVQRMGTRDWLSLAGVLLVCAVLSILAVHRFQSVNNERQTDFFETEFGDVSAGIQERIGLYEYGVRGVRGMLVAQAPGQYSLQSFRNYMATRDLEREFPGARGFGLIFNVSHDNLNRFQAEMSSEYGEFKAIRNLGLRTDQHFVIRYIEPLERNQEAVGLNIASEQNRYSAAIQSVMDGQARLTAPITAVQTAVNTQSAFLMLLPIQRVFKPGDDFNNRLNATEGWAYAVLVIDEIMSKIKFDHRHLAVRLSDVTSPSAPVPFYQSTQVDGPHALQRKSTLLNVYGRQWQLDAALLPSYNSDFKPYNMVWIGLLTFTLSFGVLLLVAQLIRGRNRDVAAKLYQLKLTSAIIEGSPLGKVLADLDGRIVDVNTRLLDMFNYRREEIIGEAVEVLVPESARARHREHRKHYDFGMRSMNVGRILSGRRHDGSEFPIEATLNTIEVGQRRFVLVGINDVTERVGFIQEIQRINTELESTVQQRTQQLREAQSTLNKIVDSVPVMIGYWNHDIDMTYANQRLRAFVEQLENTAQYDELFSAGSEHVQAALSGTPARFEYTVLLPGATRQYLLIDYIPHKEQDELRGFFTLIQDVSDLKQLQMNAELTSKQKSAFLAVMSHEIRTPLNGVLGYASLLRDRVEDEALRADLEVLHSSAQTMTMILNDILDLSKIESGQFRVEKIPFVVFDQIKTCITLHGIPAHDKGLTLLESYQGLGRDDYFLGDPTRFRQVIHNLVSNAMKFTESGEIEVSACYTPSNQSQGMLRVSVRDTGIGISTDKHKDIFKPFFQAEDSTFRKYGGTGLGLSIVQSVVLSMGGRIWFDSVLGEGTTFHFELPMERAPVQTDPAKTGQALKVPSQSILIVDDMPINLKILRKLLENDGHRVVSVVSGEAAVRACETEKFDLIFMDISMPGISGYEATRQIRVACLLNSETPVVALSGHAFDEDIHQASEAGMCLHLSKPLDIERVRLAVANHARGVRH